MTETARFLRFNAVGILGFFFQLGLLWALHYGLEIPYLPATVIAVETTVLHNYLWHEKWTWKDRPAAGHRQRFWRLVRFNLSNGAVSLVGNPALMALLVEMVHLPVLAASCVAVSACSLLNFLLCREIVIRCRTTLRTAEPQPR